MELPPGPHRPGWNTLSFFFPFFPNLSLVHRYRQPLPPPPLPSPILSSRPHSPCLPVVTSPSTYHHRCSPQVLPQCFLSFSPPLPVSLYVCLLVMKSSEQVFNNRRISNYHATVTGMHTFLSLYFCLLLPHCHTLPSCFCLTFMVLL